MLVKVGQDTVERSLIEKMAWAVLREQADILSDDDYLDTDFQYDLGTSNSCLLKMVKEKYIEHFELSGVPAENILIRGIGWSKGIVEVVRDVYWEAISLGLIAPGKLGQPLNWQVYQFTQKGLCYLNEGEILLSTSNHIECRIREIIDDYKIDPAILPIIEEAYRCWKSRCNRASIVLIGLSMENTCIELLDTFQDYPKTQGTQNEQNWNKAIDQTRGINSRLIAGNELLQFIKNDLSRTYRKQKPDWWRIWEPIPETIMPYINCIRLARNSAAHSVEDIFTPAQIGLLLSSLPFALETIGEVILFLRNHPEGVELPEL